MSGFGSEISTGSDISSSTCGVSSADFAFSDMR